MENFIDHIKEALEKDLLFKITLSKPRKKKDPLKNVFLVPIALNNERVWKATIRYQTNDQTQNFTDSGLLDQVQAFLQDSFYNADLFLEDKKITLLQSKKGHSKILVNKEAHQINLQQHDHKKRRLIPESTPYLRDLGISSSSGKVYAHAQDKFKQINKFVELIASLTKEDRSISSIYDMGSGKGYLTFALHDYLSTHKNKSLTTIGVEIRDDLISKCNSVAAKNQMNGLSFQLGSIDDFEIKQADMVIALHACDIATDMAISKGIESKANYIVVAPCCHKQIRRAMQKTETALNPLLQHGILLERQAEMITDTIRALLLEAQGYEVSVFEFISSEHTGKNVMITAKKTVHKDGDALEKVKKLKKEFGIESHYLEGLLR